MVREEEKQVSIHSSYPIKENSIVTALLWQKGYPKVNLSSLSLCNALYNSIQIVKNTEQKEIFFVFKSSKWHVESLRKSSSPWGIWLGLFLQPT